jgi:hypothetical protein
LRASGLRIQPPAFPSTREQNTPLRISGWLLYDYEHVPVIGIQRASVWEIHPITKIEVKKKGQWVDLDQ